MKTRYYHILITLFCFFILKLSFTNTLIYYIHPRYTLLTTSMAAIALVINVFGILKNSSSHKSSTKALIKDLGIITVIFFGIFLPPKALSSSFASQREIETDLSLQKITKQDFDFAGSLGFETWLIKTRFGGNLEDKSEKITISGFVQYRDTLPKDTFMLTRYVMTCCAVDARPFGVLVFKSNSEKLEEGSWVEVTGKVNKIEIGNQETIVVQAESIVLKENNTSPYSY